MEKVLIGRRGTITLPAGMRKKYGLSQNDVLLVEETAQGLLLRPSVSMPVELYDEDRIAGFDEDDDEIGRVMARLGKRAKGN